VRCVVKNCSHRLDRVPDRTLVGAHPPDHLVLIDKAVGVLGGDLGLPHAAQAVKRGRSDNLSVSLADLHKQSAGEVEGQARGGLTWPPGPLIRQYLPASGRDRSGMREPNREARRRRGESSGTCAGRRGGSHARASAAGGAC
jgi:hypothetical protein